MIFFAWLVIWLLFGHGDLTSGWIVSLVAVSLMELQPTESEKENGS